jgi:hypothetical protein
MQIENDGRNDFDFLTGTWNVHHKLLKGRLKGSTEWDEFEGTCVDKKILNGLGNFDEVVMYGKAGTFHAVAVRLFDIHSKEWSIYWAAGTSGILDVPMLGGFKDGRGEFYAQEIFEGRHIYSRFIWSGVTPTSCQWEQAFSADGGKTWETNWIMEHERA